MLNVRKRGDKWEWRFEGARVAGKRRQFSKGGFKTKKEATEAGTKALAEYNGGGTVQKASESSVSDVFDAWLTQYVDANLRPKTRATYRGIVEQHLRPALGHYKVASLSPSVLQDFANGLKAKGYSRRHIVNVLSNLKNALGHAVEPMRLVQTNPMLHVRVPKVEKPARQRHVIQGDDWARIVGRFPAGNKYHLPLMLGYHAGLRISEAFALTWADVDLDAGELHVTKQVVKIKPEGGGKAMWCLGPTKTRSSVRRVKMGSTLRALLVSERARQAANRLRYGEFYARYSLRQVSEGTHELVRAPGGDVLPVVVAEDGTFVTTDSFKYCSRVVHHELGIASFDFHSLRHTHATVLIEAGAHVKSVQARLGHEKIETTLQTYVHETDAMRDESVEAFERALAHR